MYFPGSRAYRRLNKGLAATHPSLDRHNHHKEDLEHGKQLFYTWVVVLFFLHQWSSRMAGSLIVRMLSYIVLGPDQGGHGEGK